MPDDYKTFKCPFPFIVPAKYNNLTNFTLAQCLLTSLYCESSACELIPEYVFIGTSTIGSILDPQIIICQVIFILLWAFVLLVHCNNINKLRKVEWLSPVEYYRYNLARVGTVQAILVILFWLIHETRGYWYYNNNNYIDEFAAIFLFWLTLNLVEFWGAIAKIRVKLKVSRHGIPIAEKYCFLGLFALGGVVFGGLEYYGPLDQCALFSAIKFLIYAISVIVMGIRAMFFVYSIDKGIVEMKGSSNSVMRRRLVRQLRVKFGVFFAMLLGFVIFALFRAFSKFLAPSFKCSKFMINWSHRYEVPIPQYLYIFAAYVVLFQFADVSKLPCMKNVNNQISDKNASEQNGEDNANQTNSTKQIANSVAFAKDTASAAVADSHDHVVQPIE